MVKCQHATASDLPFYDIFAPQKLPFSKISDVIACNLWFGPPFPIKNPGYAYDTRHSLAYEYGMAYAVIALWHSRHSQGPREGGRGYNDPRAHGH